MTEDRWWQRRAALSRIPHPNSPAGRTFDWSSLGVPHPNSPAGRTFDWSSHGVTHPHSPAGQYVHWEPGLRRKQIVANRDNIDKLRLAAERALPKLPRDLRDKVSAMLTPKAVATLTVIAAIGIGSHWIGVGEVVDVVLIGWGVWTLGPEARNVGRDLHQFVTIATHAQTDKTLIELRIILRVRLSPSGWTG